jgi:hypothetical protein
MRFITLEEDFMKFTMMVLVDGSHGGLLHHRQGRGFLDLLGIAIDFLPLLVVLSTLTSTRQSIVEDPASLQSFWLGCARFGLWGFSPLSSPTRMQGDIPAITLFAAEALLQVPWLANLANG